MGKLFLQSLWKSDIGWDDTLSGEHEKRCQEIVNQWTSSSCDIDRVIVDTETLPNSDQFDLRVFTDASGYAYCAAAYLVHHRTDSPHNFAPDGKIKISSASSIDHYSTSGIISHRCRCQSTFVPYRATRYPA
ncbi:hypothetical protein V3C99_018484 [Haemonchus contortus]|uniref:RT_RNaseH_2 domain-containing protein n=1 Tax=Haemonchus contortus TaxID=6289 RepID=A0A7I4Z0C2_HAECO